MRNTTQQYSSEIAGFMKNMHTYQAPTAQQVQAVNKPLSSPVSIASNNNMTSGSTSIEPSVLDRADQVVLRCP